MSEELLEESKLERNLIICFFIIAAFCFFGLFFFMAPTLFLDHWFSVFVALLIAITGIFIIFKMSNDGSIGMVL